MLYLLCFAFAQDLKLPAEVPASPGTFINLVADTKGEVVKFQAIDPGISLFPADLLANKKSTVAVAMAPGRFRVLAWTAINGKPSDAVQILLVVSAGPGPGPTPPSPPAPPVPPPLTPPAPDELGQILQALYGALNEADKEGHVKTLAQVYYAAAQAAIDPRYQTMGQLFGAVRQQSLQTLPNTALQSMRERLGLVLSKELNTDPAVALSVDTRTKAAELFNRIAKLLETLK